MSELDIDVKSCYSAHTCGVDEGVLVSIITVVFNGGSTIERTIKSVLSQTFQNIEYIIVDGGSTDGTLDIIRQYEEHISCWLSGPDNGLYDAMNKGIALAGGELIGMINSDDWYEPNAVELVVDAYKKNPEKRIFHGDRYDVLSDGECRLRRFNPSRFKLIYHGITYNHPSMFVHSSIYEHTLYNANLRALSDFEFILEQFLIDNSIFCYIPKAYVNYSLTGTSAQLSFRQSLRENLIARKNAGLGVLHRLLFIVVRSAIVAIWKLKRVFNKI